MDRVIQSDWTVGDVLASYPQTVNGFLHLRTGCVGCYLARFCTLEDVSRVYDLPLRDLLDQLLDSTASNSQPKENK